MTQAIPVWVVPANELKRNGGSIEIQGGPAFPIQNPPSSQLISTDADNQLAEGTDGKLFVPSGGGVLYSVYTALLLQSGTNAPTAIIIENSISDDAPVWSYDGVGTYRITFSSIFSDDTKIFMQCGGRAGIYEYGYMFGGALRLQTNNQSGSPSNNIMSAYTFFEIRIYP